MKMKKALSMLLAGTMTFGLVACGGTEEAATTPEGGATTEAGDNKITIWAWDEQFNVKAANVAKEMYAEVDPTLAVEIVTMSQEDIVAKLNTSLASGSYSGLPDLVLIEDYRIGGYLNAYQNEFADLTDIVPEGAFADFKQDVSTIDGVRYGVPFDSGVGAVFYRTDLIEQAGYTQADMQDLTWDKYIEIGVAVKEKTGVNMLTLDPNEVGQIRMMLQSAGSWYTDAEGNVDIENNQALKDSINTYKRMVDAGITQTISGWDQFVGAFNNGEVATVPTGCWISPSIVSQADQSGKWAVAAFPRMAENANSVNASSLGGAGWYVLKNVGHEEQAKAFLKETFASNVELMNQLAVDINLVSTLKAASTAENYSKGLDFYGGQEIFQDFAKWTTEVPSVVYGENTYICEGIIVEAMQEILNGADIDTTLAAYQKQIEAVVVK